MPISGKVVILNESGEAIPHQPATVTFFSHYPPDDVARPDYYRRQNFPMGESFPTSEFWVFNSIVTKFSATLFVHTNDGKYAAIVHVEPEPPPTDLTIELHPRYSATGRLLGGNVNPQKFRLVSRQQSEYSVNRSGGRYVINETFHSVELETDSTGLFTVDHLIPGAEYCIYIHYQPGVAPRTSSGITPRAFRAGSLNVPFLSEEEYAQPYSLGDIFVSSTPVPKQQ